MPLILSHDRAVVLIRQSAFERNGLTRGIIDERFNLTDEEFRVEDGLIAVGPLPSDDMLPDLVDALENSGLVYFDDFFELSGNWPGLSRDSDESFSIIWRNVSITVRARNGGRRATSPPLSAHDLIAERERLL